MNRGTYYNEKLKAGKLFRCYEVAPPRIVQHLNAEVEFVSSNLQHADLALELGCGYGRVLKPLSKYVSWISGNDISRESLKFAKSYMGSCQNYGLFLMDASQMSFCTGVFDVVFCIQNGISAFGVNRKRLVAEAIRVTKRDGIILFSSYSPKIWEARLEWFKEQARFSLIGEIDEEKTHDGRIVCKDGFEATTVSGKQLLDLFNEFGLDASVSEMDESSVFCKAIKQTSRA